MLYHHCAVCITENKETHLCLGMLFTPVITLLFVVVCCSVSKADALGLFRTFIKQLYDLRMSSSAGGNTRPMLPELYIDNFDNEQIFQQLEMFNNHAVEQHRRAIKAVPERYHGRATKIKNSSLSSQISEHTMDSSRSEKKHVTFKSDNRSDLVADSDEEEIEAGSDVDSEEESVLQKLLDSMTDKKTPVENDDIDNDVDDDGDDDDDNDSEATLTSDSSDDNSDNDNNNPASASRHGVLPKQKNRQVSAVDDRFFKLAEMEAFLDEQDVREQRQHSADAHDSEDDDDDDDYDLSTDDKVLCCLFFDN